MTIVAKFPKPPNAVIEALNVLQTLRSGSADEIAALPSTEHPERPWDPSRCSDEFRHLLWMWLDDVAAWINQEYGWRPTTSIPACWPQHPHIVHELAVLACQRYTAAGSLGTELLEEWHRYCLPGFLDRMSNRLGGSSCINGTHIDWPGRPRDSQYRAQDVVNQRHRIFHEDVTASSVRQLRPTASS